MPWKECTKVSERAEFVRLVKAEEKSVSELCREFGISRKTGYKWLRRYEEGGDAALVDRSRRPHSSPNRTVAEVEEGVLAVRQAHRTWGGRKIRAYLERHEHTNLPSPSTMTEILRRYGYIDPEEAKKHRAYQRFEMSAANELWQMDFKGHFPVQEGVCHPLTILDDHSRYLIALQACPDQRRETVQAALEEVFQAFGLPQRMLMDNGSPWGDTNKRRYTRLTVWLIRLGVKVSHSRPRHPQTVGKDERVHRTLQEELLDQQSLETLPECQTAFDRWRLEYNYIRPHQGIADAVPADRFSVSTRAYPESLPPIEYGPDDIVRKTDKAGKIYFRNGVYRIGRAFQGLPVALRPLPKGSFAVYFCGQKIAQIDLVKDDRSRRKV